MQLDMFSQNQGDDFTHLIEEYEKLKKPKEGQRIHYDIPTYKKVYSVYQFDWNRYVRFFRTLRFRAYKTLDNKGLESAQRYWDKINPYEIINRCIILDGLGKPKHLGDEHHIYRIDSLRQIHHKIYDYCEKEALQQFGVSKQHGLICHIEDQQAELANTWHLPIKQRLKLHIQVLRNLQKGLSLEESTKEIKL
ncbi:MAG: hypothetical protein NC408_04580 [Candidatus Gastranaerophilales bacterium]|nr:hypothetical protein [Candidatus Gastranaerophilales bacterium]MCM1072252.1 hypothetical protein [Bacteroides sp.]